MEQLTPALKRAALACALIACAASLALAPAQAEFPGAHPGYRKALGDLRIAYRNLNVQRDMRNVNSNVDQALDAINAAITNIKAAGVNDGEVMQAPLLDADLINNRRGRLREALRALRDADHDVHGEEDNGGALALRNHAEGDIMHAIGHVERALRDIARADCLQRFHS